MARQQINPTEQIPNGSLIRSLFNVLTTGNAVITKVFAGAGTSITQSGADPGTGDVTINTSIATNQQTSSYTVIASDQSRVLTFKSTSAVTATLPQATGSFASPFWLYIQNSGSGLLTIIPVSSTIDGATSLILTTNQNVIIVAFSGNYISLRGNGVSNSQSIANSIIFG